MPAEVTSCLDRGGMNDKAQEKVDSHQQDCLTKNTLNLSDAILLQNSCVAQQQQHDADTCDSSAFGPTDSPVCSSRDVTLPVTKPILHSHSNDNLLKIDTGDRYSTVAAIKRYIAKSLPALSRMTSMAEGCGNNSSDCRGSSCSNHDDDCDDNHANATSDVNCVQANECFTQNNTAASQPLFAGLRRMNKNPRNPYLFLAFDTERQRAEAAALLQTVQYRHHTWTEVAVSRWDLSLTHKGGKRAKFDTGDVGERVGKRARESKKDSTCCDSLSTSSTKQLTSKCVDDVGPASAAASSTHGTVGPASNNNDVDVSDNNNDYTCDDDVANYEFSKQNNTATRERARVSKLTQYANLPMTEQLSRKTQHCLAVLKALLPPRQHGRTTYMDRFHGVLPSPVLVGYRNHVQLTFGYDESGCPTLGFNKGSVIDGTVAIESAVRDDSSSSSAALTMHPIAVVVAKAIMRVCEEFLPRVAHSTDGAKQPSSTDAITPSSSLALTSNEINSATGEGQDKDDAAWSTLNVLDRVSGSGFWRRAQIRHNVLGAVMVDLEINPAGVSDAQRQHVCDRLVHILLSPEMEAKIRGATVNVSMFGSLQQQCNSNTSASNWVGKVVSLQYHTHMGISSIPSDTPRLLLGHTQATLTEELSGLHFELSPTSFFQVNTPGMELMMRQIAHWAALTPRTILLDLCSGTGTIGLALAASVARVIGIELVESAVRNARRNAERNRIGNAEFHCGPVERVLPNVIAGLRHAAAHQIGAGLCHASNSNWYTGGCATAISKEQGDDSKCSSHDNHEGPNSDPGEASTKAQSSAGLDANRDIVAIIDPPRAGVNATVLKWIRGTAAIRRVIYISCEQRALERDCPHLMKTSTKAYRGVPFEITASFAVDLFPHTQHVEMVVVLTRMTNVNDAGVHFDAHCGEAERGEVTTTSSATTT